MVRKERALFYLLAKLGIKSAEEPNRLLSLFRIYVNEL